VRFYYPDLLGNEAGKLIAARRIFEPAFLSSDWLQSAPGEDVLYEAFSALVAPLWLLLKDAILVVLVGRLLIWALLLYALLRLARALEVESYALAIGLAAWVFFNQSLGAGEWIFGGIEGKCVGYALLFLAMESALQKRLLPSALYSGLAIWFHVLVGGWGALALGGSLLACHRNYGLRRALQFCAITAAFLLPLVALFLRSTDHPSVPGSSAEANRLIVLFRNPHHLDPLYFHGYAEFSVACVLAGLTVFAMYKLISRDKAALVSCFLAILLAQFAAGLLARRLELFWFLKSYPFRLADVLIGLLFAVTVPMLALWLVRRGLAARYHVLAWGVLLVAAVLPMAKSASAGGQHLQAFAQSWSLYVRHQESPWQEMTHWINRNTPPSSIFIAPPWEGAFWIEAERAEVVNFKRAPHSLAILEWHERMVALNGGPFHSRSDGALDEMRQHYQQLDAAHIAAVARAYDASYFLSSVPLVGMNGQLVHANGSYYLYQLNP
jgi:hypothetical protein